MSTAGDDDAPLIYGLEFQARALAAQLAETETTRFMVGTQSLKMSNNQIHVVELNDETGALYTQIYNHGVGEVWWLHWSPHDPKLFTSVYNTLTESGCEMKSTIWKIPEDLECQELESVCSLPVPNDYGNIKTTTFHPTEEKVAATIAENKFVVWDFGKGDPVITSVGALEGKGHQKMTTGKWNPQESSSQLATVQDGNVRGWDLRAANKSAWSIDQAHSQLVRDVDYNRNRQYFVGTCGDDGACRFWDVRKTTSPVVTLSHHSHWVWCLRYNACHDQLVVSASSDARVVLASVASIASEPMSEQARSPADGVLVSYDHHEDSVYCVEWSPVDPWCFASLSYDGRLLINRVPKTHKYRILGI